MQILTYQVKRLPIMVELMLVMVTEKRRKWDGVLSGPVDSFR